MRIPVLFVFLLAVPVTINPAARGQGNQELPAAGKSSAGAVAAGSPERKYEDFNRLVQGGKTHEGFFTLHHKEDRLYLEIQPHQFDKPFLMPMAVARGSGMGGFTLDDEMWVLVLRKVGDKVHLIRRNTRFQAKKSSPLAKAVETTYYDSVLLALRIQSINPARQGVLISMNDWLMTNFAQLPAGYLDPNRSTWHKIKVFPNNVEIELAATFAGGSLMGRDSVIDSRGNTVILHYGLAEMPDSGYQPRLADDRVGYFLSVVKDFSSDQKDTSFLRYVNRWRLEKVDSSAKLSPPKKKIVFWIEKSVPDEYRTFVREGILEWNKAFEKIGFRDAIEVRQQESEDFDPEDIRFNTFRWVAHGQQFAIGPSRANPLTGEILDADILFDADMIRSFRQTYSIQTGGNSLVDNPPSPILAYRNGWNLMNPLLLRKLQQEAGDEERSAALEWEDRSRLAALHNKTCQCGAQMRSELSLAAMMLAQRENHKTADKLPEELIGQAIKEIVMHEVGHTLGLRHNFKASTMLANDKLNDLGLTRKDGMVGSVMDYNPINLAPKGVKQGDYFTTTIGPYDYWSIEYAYKPLTGGTEGEMVKLQELANRGTQTGNDYATDEDLYTNADPLVNQWDLGNDPMRYALERIHLTEELMKSLSDKVVDNGEGYQRMRQAFSILLHQYGDAAHLVSRYVGGEHMNRDHRGDPKARDPFVPVKASKQREALKFLQAHILTDKPYQFTPLLLRRLAADRWYHWGNEGAALGSVEFPLHERVLQIQRIVLNQLLSADVLLRIQNNSLKTEKDEQALTLAEVFRCLTDGIWGELADCKSKSVKESSQMASSVVRRNLQREYVRDLSSLVLGKRAPATANLYVLLFGGPRSRTAPADARSLAYLHLRTIGGLIDSVLQDKQIQLEDTCRAHLVESRDRIGKVLGASIQVNEP